MSEHDTYMTLESGEEVLVIFQVESYGSDPSGLSGPPENYDPGSAPELYFIRAIDEHAAEVTVSKEEQEKIEQKLLENPDWWMPDFYDEPDWD